MCPGTRAGLSTVPHLRIRSGLTRAGPEIYPGEGTGWFCTVTSRPGVGAHLAVQTLQQIQSKAGALWGSGHFSARGSVATQRWLAPHRTPEVSLHCPFTAWTGPQLPGWRPPQHWSEAETVLLCALCLGPGPPQRRCLSIARGQLCSSPFALQWDCLFPQPCLISKTTVPQSPETACLLLLPRPICWAQTGNPSCGLSPCP